MEQQISQGIIESYFRKLTAHLDNDVVIAGGGPSGLVAARSLAQKGYRVALFEKKLAPGGGMWGGAMMFNEIIIQESAVHILDEFGIRYRKHCEGLYTFDSIESTAALIYRAVNAGVKIFNCVAVEDLIVKKDRVAGLVINWSPVSHLHLHIDPLMISSKVTLDSTGHPSELVGYLTNKNGIVLQTGTGSIIGEKSLDVETGEQATVANTGPVYPGLYVSGMSANNVHGKSRMGPIFGGMLLSGLKAAELIAKELEL